jgi:hypothetical protein
VNKPPGAARSRRDSCERSEQNESGEGERRERVQEQGLRKILAVAEQFGKDDRQGSDHAEDHRRRDQTEPAGGAGPVGPRDRADKNNRP